MSHPLSISEHVQARFSEVFGPPHNTLGRDHHWRFQTSPGTVPIDVLVNGTLEIAAIWIFTHYHGDGVITAAITSKDEAEAMIKRIQETVKSASKFPNVKK